RNAAVLPSQRCASLWKRSWRGWAGDPHSPAGDVLRFGGPGQVSTSNQGSLGKGGWFHWGAHTERLLPASWGRVPKAWCSRAARQPPTKPKERAQEPRRGCCAGPGSGRQPRGQPRNPRGRGGGVKEPQGPAGRASAAAGARLPPAGPGREEPGLHAARAGAGRALRRGRARAGAGPTHLGAESGREGPSPGARGRGRAARGRGAAVPEAVAGMAAAMAEARLRRKQLLSAEEAELFELAQAAGSGLDPEVFRVLLDLLRMNVAPLAVFQVLKSMCAGQRLLPGPEAGPPAAPAPLPADTRGVMGHSNYEGTLVRLFVPVCLLIWISLCSLIYAVSVALPVKMRFF
uniref:Uncharacterized protein n=1 Tax=Calidris pygmaea TaxID=425635 RepID=A0A8C3JUS9_9CHAR